MLRWLKFIFSERKPLKFCRMDCKYCTKMEDKYYNFPPYELICQPKCNYCNPGVTNV